MHTTERPVLNDRTTCVPDTADRQIWLFLCIYRFFMFAANPIDIIDAQRTAANRTKTEKLKIATQMYSQCLSLELEPIVAYDLVYQSKSADSKINLFHIVLNLEHTHTLINNQHIHEHE